MAHNATDITLLEPSQVVVPRASGEVRNEQEDLLQEKNERKELHFKASHLLLAGFLLWILYVR